MTKRILSFLLALSMLFCLFACGNSETAPETAETEPEVDPYEGKKYIGDLEDANLGGFELKVLTSHLRNNWFPGDMENIAEVLDIAMHTRNVEVENRYNATINYIICEDWKEVFEKARNEAMAGDGAYDIVSGYASDICSKLALSHLLTNWSEIPHVNPDKPYYVQNATDAFSINHQKTMMVGEWSTSAINSCNCYIVNKDGAAIYQLPNLFDMVDIHEWTNDAFLSMMRDIYSDIDGIDGRTEDDYYGFTTDTEGLCFPYYFSWEMNLIGKDEDDYPILLPLSEKITQNYARLYNLLWQTTGTYTFKQHHIGVDKFILGQSLFTIDTMNGLRGQKMRDVPFDYGVLPVPLATAEQEDYITACDGADAQVILRNVDPDRFEAIGYLYEALNAYSAEYVSPVICNSTLKIKGARADEDSARMIDLILGKRVFSMAMLDMYNLPVSPIMLLSNNLKKQKDSIVSYYDKNAGKTNKFLEKIIEEYENYEG